MFGYILIYKNDKKKYEIGKRYNKYIYYYKELYNIGYLCTKESKIFKIKIFHTVGVKYAEDFKIVKEVNYEEAYKGIYEKIVKDYLLSLFMFLFIKTHNEIFFNELIEARKTHSRNIKELIDKAIISSGNYSYIDRVKNLTKSAKIYLLQEIGRNKDIAKFIKNKDKNVLTEIIKIGRPQDLDILIKSENNWLISKILRHGREKDVNIYIKNFDDTIFQNIIIETGIDKYMDYIIENNLENIHEILLADVGRKKDLDKIIKTKNEYVLSIIINNQYEEHLHLLSHHYYSDISKLAEETLTECNLKTIWKINI